MIMEQKKIKVGDMKKKDATFQAKNGKNSPS